MRTSVQRPRSLKPKSSSSSLPRANCSRGSSRLERAVPAAVPHDHRARAVVAGRDHALEVARTRAGDPRRGPRGASPRRAPTVPSAPPSSSARRPSRGAGRSGGAGPRASAPRRAGRPPGGRRRRTARACAPGRASCDRPRAAAGSRPSESAHLPLRAALTAIRCGRPSESWSIAACGGTVQSLTVMPPHSIGSGTISFGLVSIPVKMFTAASSAGVASTCSTTSAAAGSSSRRSARCATRSSSATPSSRATSSQKDQYVRFTDEELKALEGEASKIDRHRRVRAARQVDPIYFEKTYYLGPDKGGEKAYRLLADAMAKSEPRGARQVRDARQGEPRARSARPRTG